MVFRCSIEGITHRKQKYFVEYVLFVLVFAAVCKPSMFKLGNLLRKILLFVSAINRMIISNLSQDITLYSDIDGLKRQAEEKRKVFYSILISY